VREEKEHREGKIAGDEKEYREPQALLALPPSRWIHASCTRLHRSPGGRTRAGRREEEARRRVDPLASARRKKPRRDPDRSPAPTAASCLRRAGVPTANRRLQRGGFGEEIWGNLEEEV